MEVKVKKNNTESSGPDANENLIRAVGHLLEKFQVPGIVPGLFGSYLDGDITREELTGALEDLTSGESRLQNIVPVFNEYLEVDHIVDKEYGLVANYKPLFDEEQNLVGFVPHWIYEKE